MKTTRFLLIVGASMAMIIPPARAQTVKRDEEGLWNIWKLHTEHTTNNVAIIRACIDFKKKNPFDPLGRVTQGLVAWHFLKAGKIDASSRLMESMVRSKTSNMQKAGSYMAQTWLTRAEMAQLKQRLKRYYLDNMEFPPDLTFMNQLPEAQRVPFKDRFGDPWHYKLTGFKMLKGLLNQKYELWSVKLDNDSDLLTAIARPYGGNLRLQPLRVVSSTKNAEAVMFDQWIEAPAPVEEEGGPPSYGADDSAPERKRVTYRMGMNSGGIYLAYFGNSLVILNDGSYWHVIARPR